MRFLDLAFASLLMAIGITGILWKLRMRRRARREAEAEEAEARREAAREEALDGVDPDERLAALGFTEPVVIDGAFGARGTYQGVSLLALPSEDDDDGWTVAVELPEEARRLRVSATPQGLTRKRRSLVLGMPGVDARLDVTGDRGDALLLFGRPGARALVDAIALHGWSLEDGELTWEGPTLGSIELALETGTAAGRVLLGLPT